MSTHPELTLRGLMGNVQWRIDGTVTASFLTPTHNVRNMARGLRTQDYHRWAGLYATLPGAYQHQAIIRQTPISAVMDRMAAAVPGGPDNLADHPAWAQKMADTANLLSNLDQQPVEKWSLLTVALPLPKPPLTTTAAWTARAILADVMPPPPSEAEQIAARRAADALARRLRILIPRITPATEGQLRWTAAFAASFGGIEPPFTHPRFADHSDTLTTLVPLGDSHINADHRPSQHIEIDGPLVADTYLGDLHTAGRRQRVYQTFLVVNAFARAWVYPDAALWNDLDELPFPTRTALMGQPIANAAARKSLNGLYKHLNWTDEESGTDSTPHIDAEEARRDLDDELAALVQHGGPALPTTIVLGLAADSAAELEERVNVVRDLLDPTQTQLARPRGTQTKLWASLLPGGPQPYTVRSLALQVHAPDLAGLGIFHGPDLGDPDGRIYALTAAHSEDTPPRLVHRNATRGPRDNEGNKGATHASVGDIGSGKTLAVKEDSHDVLCLGGGVFVLDKSQDREWTRASLAFPVPVAIVDPTSTDVSIDPLRVFTSNLPADPTRSADMLQWAEKHTLGYLAIKCSIRNDDDPRYDVLTAAVTALLRPDPPLPPSMPSLLTLLRYRAGDEDLPPAPTLPTGEVDPRFRRLSLDVMRDAAAAVASRLDNIKQSSTTGGALFEGRVPLDLTIPAIIWSEPGLKLNNADARARVYLASAYGVAFMTATERFNQVTLPELAGLSGDPFGEELVDDVLRQSRRAYGGLNTDSQLASDYTLPGLFVARTAARTADYADARRALEFVGMTPTPEDIAALTVADSGTKVYRDSKGRIGWVDVVPPVNATRFRLFRTDPGRPVDDAEKHADLAPDSDTDSDTEEGSAA